MLSETGRHDVLGLAGLGSQKTKKTTQKKLFGLTLFAARGIDPAQNSEPVGGWRHFVSNFLGLRLAPIAPCALIGCVSPHITAQLQWPQLALASQEGERIRANGARLGHTLVGLASNSFEESFA